MRTIVSAYEPNEKENVNTYHNCDLLECVEKFIRTNFIMQQHPYACTCRHKQKHTLTRTYPAKCANRTVSLIGGIAMFQMSFCFYFSHSFFFKLLFSLLLYSCTSSSLLASNKRETAKLSILKREKREEKCWNFKQFYMNAVKLQKYVFFLLVCLL